jgi:replicative DNA helicase
VTHTLAHVTFDKAHEALSCFNAGLVTPFVQGASQLTLPSNGVTVVAAKTGEGKTSLMLNLLLHGLRENTGKRFYFVSYEEPDYHLLLKLLMILSGVSLDKQDNFAAFVSHFRTHGFNSESPANREFSEPLRLVAEWLDAGTLQLYRTETPCDVMANELEAEQEVGAIFVDYIQRVVVPDAIQHRERYLQLKWISQCLHTLARAVKAPVVTGAQRKHQYQTNSSLIDSIRESSDITHDASLVLVLTKETKGDSFKKKYKLHVCKNRFGRSDYDMNLHFNGPSYSFSSSAIPSPVDPFLEDISATESSDEGGGEWTEPKANAKRKVGQKAA